MTKIAAVIFFIYVWTLLFFYLRVGYNVKSAFMVKITRTPTAKTSAVCSVDQQTKGITAQPLKKIVKKKKISAI
jgi:hypothetical protein